MSMLAKAIPEEHGAPVDVQREFLRTQELTIQLLQRVREMSLDLRPALLDDLGLLPALLAHFESYQEQTGIRVNFRHGNMDRRFAPGIETAAYRIIQEALTNVVRYAGVDQVYVRLRANEEIVSFQVEDHGHGFDPHAALSSGRTVGLPGMQERANACGGELIIESAPGDGTCLTAELPLVKLSQKSA
jgi:signal transduction histidine kinase